MTDVSPLIDAMGLAPHPEGGHYRRTWTAPTHVDTPRGSRHSASAIIFLLDRDEEARWHLVHSDELWIWSGPGTWQRTFARGDYALATCVVSPEFTFDDWKLAEGA